MVLFNDKLIGAGMTAAGISLLSIDHRIETLKEAK